MAAFLCVTAAVAAVVGLVGLVAGLRNPGPIEDGGEPRRSPSMPCVVA
jgi:hypothetical protein